MHAADFYTIWATAAFLVVWTWVASQVVENIAEGLDENRPMD